MSKQIVIKANTELRIPWQELHGIQGALKMMTKERFAKCRARIIKKGVTFALHVWKEQVGKKAIKWWIIDGHGRHAVIGHMLTEDGFDCPPLPCVEVIADSFKEAKLLVLDSSSQYHEMTGQGLYEFMSDEGLTIADVEEYELSDIPMEDFKNEYFTDSAELPDLPTGEKQPFQQMTFTLHDDQADQVKAAMELAGTMGDYTGPNENKNGNALARICETFLTQNIK